MQPDSHNAPKKSGAWFVVFALVLLGLFFAATLIFRGGAEATTDPEDAARDAERIKNLADLQAEDAKKLNEYAWADQAAGTVRIPINEAMKLVLADLNSKKPAPAYPVLDNTGQPVPPTVLPVPAPLTTVDDDKLPAETSNAESGSTVLSAPVESPTPKPAKNKKTPKAQ
jgi:hypothetical protein